MFVDKNNVAWELDNIRLVRKVASFSGLTRVLLANLKTNEIPPLMKQAMERTNIFDICCIPDQRIKASSHLNQLQLKAVAALD